MSILEVDRPEAKVLVLGPGLAGTLMTPEEFDHAGEADRSFTYELIRGVLVVAPPPLVEERGPNEELGFQLRLYKTQHPQGSALDDTLPEQHVPASGNRRRADRVIWTGLGRVPNPLTDMPTIVAEFFSEGRRNRHRDFIEKGAECLAAGICEYWIIDRFERTFTACRSDGSDVSVSENGTYTTPLLPGFELSVGRLFEVADRWRLSKEQP
jgi:Uma2 family endonuclease